MTEAKSQNYWISPTALRITLNALSDADYMQASAASGAMIMCYMKGIDGLEYDHGHNYKRWPLKIAQTYFTTTTRKYVYIRIPRPTADVADVETDTALVVYPSERVDIYGMTEGGRQLLDSSFYYIYTQGIISASEPTTDGLRRHWEQEIVTGTLASDEATEGGGTGEWWSFDPLTDMVTFLKKIAHAAFEYLIADQADVEELTANKADINELTASQADIEELTAEQADINKLTAEQADINELTAGNAVVQKFLKAYNSMINKVRSSNYTGDSAFDTGWHIVNDYEGNNSQAVFDYLYVRKKAIFEELEIRKMTYIGGNFVFSPASGRVWRVEAYKDYQIRYDSHGEQYIEVNKNDLLGYSELTVPYSLGGTMLSLFKKLYGRITGQEQGRYLLGRKKLIARKFTPEELSQMKMVRCYLFSDDGTTETMNWWKVGAQARCQTFNIESQVKWDGERYTGSDVANTYWWRLVSGTGRGVCDDGESHEYLDFLIKTGSAEGDKSVADAASDVPMVGDQMVQFGHRTNPQYANVIVMETVGTDAPAFKEYRGIMGWDLTGKQKTKISPTTGTVMYSTAFHIETEYGDVLVPKDRGAWQNIPYESGTTERRCYYYDRVEHGGSLWLCITPEGTYTTIEPGDSTSAQQAVWQKQVSKGDKGETSFKSQVFKRATSKPSKPTGGSFADPVPAGWSDGIPDGTDTIWMTTRIFTTDGKAPQQAAWTDVQLMSDTESFDVEFSPVAANPGNPTDNPGNWFDPTTDPTADWANMIWMAERTKANGVWGNWKISKIKGEKGAFKSRVFKRTNTDISSQRPTGGDYNSPFPTSGGWTDGIPSGAEILWSSVRTFDVTGAASEWSLPVKETDTATLDIEFSPNSTCPAAPYGADASQKDSQTYISQRQAQGWYDPSRLPSGQTMIWRAERKIANGVYNGDWVMTRIYGEKGADGTDGTNATTTALKYTGPLAAGATAPTVANYRNFTWTDAIPTQTEALPNVYVGVWQYMAGTPLDINTTPPTQVTLFAHYGQTGAAGQNGRDGTDGRDGRDGTNGTNGTNGLNGTSILVAPNAVIINQQRSGSGAEPLTNINYPIVIVARDSGTIVAATISNLTMNNCTAEIVSGTNGTTQATVRITAISYDLDPDGTTKRYRTSGAVAFHVVATTLAGNAFSADLSVPFGCNLLGQYTLDIEEDVKTEVSSKVTAEINERNLVNVSTMETAITMSAEGLNQNITRVDNRLNAGGDISNAISNTNSRIDTADESIQTLTTESLEYIDVSKWEKGSTDNETAGKTYEQIKNSSDTRIRLKTLIPITANTAISLANTSYQVGIVYFGSDKKTVVYSGSTAWRGWITGSDSVITTHPSSAAYIAILLKKTNNASIATSEVTASKLYISDSAYSTVKQTADSITNKVVTPLRETGINITDGTITAQADNFLIKNSSGVGTIGINNNGDLFSVGSATFKGGLFATYMYSDTETLEVTAAQGERHVDILDTGHKYNTFYIIANGSTKIYLNLPNAASFHGIELCFFHPVFTSSTGMAWLVYNSTSSKLYSKQNGLYAEVTYSEGYPIPKNTFIRVRSINNNWFIIDNI